MRIQLLPVLSPIVPIFAFQMPEFLLGLHQLGGTFLARDFILCWHLPHLNAGARLQCGNFSFLNLQVPFNLLCVAHLSVSCMPDIFLNWGGPLFFNFQGFPEPVLLSSFSLQMIFRMNIFPPCIFVRYQKREGKNSLFCAPNYHKMQWERYTRHFMA